MNLNILANHIAKQHDTKIEPIRSYLYNFRSHIELYIWFIRFLFFINSLYSSKNNDEKKYEKRTSTTTTTRTAAATKKIVFIENKTKQADSFVHILSVFMADYPNLTISGDILRRSTHES